MEPFDLIRFLGRCLQVVGTLVGAGSLSFSWQSGRFTYLMWRDNPGEACLLVLGGMAAWLAGSRTVRWAAENDPTATPHNANSRPGPPLANGKMRHDWLGREARAVTPLRPYGCVEIDGERVEVVSEHEYIPAGATVTIVAFQGNHLVARTTIPRGDAAE
jgi:hypothetical protein